MVEDITSFLDLRSFTCWAVQERRISLPSDSRNIEPQLVVARSTLLTFKNKFSAQLTRSSCTKYFIDGLKYLSPPGAPHLLVHRHGRHPITGVGVEVMTSKMPPQLTRSQCLTSTRILVRSNTWNHKVRGRIPGGLFPIIWKFYKCIYYPFYYRIICLLLR